MNKPKQGQHSGNNQESFNRSVNSFISTIQRLAKNIKKLILLTREKLPPKKDGGAYCTFQGFKKAVFVQLTSKGAFVVPFRTFISITYTRLNCLKPHLSQWHTPICLVYS